MADTEIKTETEQDKTVNTADADPERTELFGALTPEELASLTEEERAGIEMAESGEDEDEEAATDERDEAEEDDGTTEAAASEQPIASPEKTETPEQQETPVAETTAPDEDEDIVDIGPAVPDWQMPDNGKDQLADLDKQAEDLATQFDAGEMTAGEFHKKLSAINATKSDLSRQIDRAEMAAQMRQSHFINVAVKQFLHDHQQYSPENPTMYNMLDAEVRRLQMDATDPFDPSLLRKAHKNIEAAIGKFTVKADKSPPAQEQPKADNVVRLPPKSEKPKVPPTLARVPADEIDDQGDGKYGRLDRLAETDPLAYEEALAKMPASERDEYLRAG